MARGGRPNTQRNRAAIAQVAARLIAEHGLSDWASAKRKACRELGLADDEPLPNNAEVEQALRDYNTLFRAATHPGALRAQRQLALRWMERLSVWNPVLIGGVADGWATAHSDVRLELEAEDSKMVELALVNGGIAYTAASAQASGASPVQLLVDHHGETVRLTVVTPQHRRHRSRRDDDTRISADGLRQLLATVRANETDDAAAHDIGPR